MDSKTLIRNHLDEAHAIEAALVTNLAAHITQTPDPEYRALLQRHLDETRGHLKAVEKRRDALGGSGRGVIAGTVGLARDVIGQVLVLTKGPIDALRTPSAEERMLKNARDECATEAIEIAVYDALETVAKAAGDRVTAKLARDHRADEEKMLADLRATITTLAVAAYESRTGDNAKPQVKAAATRKAASVG